MARQRRTLKDRLADVASNITFLVIVFLGVSVGTFATGVVLIALNYLSTGDYDISRPLTFTEAGGDFLRGILLIAWTLIAILVGYFLGMKAQRMFDEADERAHKRFVKRQKEAVQRIQEWSDAIDRESAARRAAEKQAAQAEAGTKADAAESGDPEHDSPSEPRQ